MCVMVRWILFFILDWFEVIEYKCGVIGWYVFIKVCVVIVVG